MGTMVMRNDLGTLENGLKDLRTSRLMGIKEFKDMYGAIERHHRDLRLAHLTGKEKDMLTQAKRDTKFFHVLVKMMSEVKQLKTGKQKESLKKVHTWYMANRHTLSSRPHFGKSYQLQEANDFRQKITKSPRKGGEKGDAKAGPEVTETVSIGRLSSAEGLRRFFKSVTPSSSKRGRDSPAKGAPVIFELPSNKDYINDYLTHRFLGGDDFDFQTEPPNTHQFPGVSVQDSGIAKFEEVQADNPSLFGGTDNELQDLLTADAFPGADIEDDHGPPPSSPRLDEASNVSPHYIESLITESHREIDDSGSINTDDLANTSEMEYPDFRRKLSRGQTASASLRGALTDQSSNVSAAVLPKKMIHPIASLVNPHAQLAALEAKRAEEEYFAARETPIARAASSKSRQSEPPVAVLRPTSGQTRITLDNLQGFKNFSRDLSYGQEILRGQMIHPVIRPPRRRGKLNFVGRSGTAVDVRYAAHDNAEMPEAHTSNVIAFYAAQDSGEGQVKVHGPVAVQDPKLAEKSLEDFYQLTDNYYPAKLPKYRPHSSKARLGSKEPANKHQKGSQGKPHVPKLQLLGKHLLADENKENKGAESDTARSDVKLDDVVGMIDDVTDDMTYFKEKLAPRPHPGFRHPASAGVSMIPLSRPSTANSVPQSRPNTAPQRPSTATGVRTCSPVQRSNTPTEGDVVTSRLPNHNPFMGRDILIPNSDTPDTLITRPTPNTPVNPVIQAIDWRGKITPDSTRYKWQTTRFGGHTYVKKLKANARPVGATHGGSRPKTAPARWKTDKPNENNTRITSQAATHHMTQVDQEALDSMLIVNHLVGSSDSKMGSLNDLFMNEAFLRSFTSKYPSSPSTVTNTPVPMEYVSIVSRPRSLIDSRTQSRQTRNSERPDSILQFRASLPSATGAKPSSQPSAEGTVEVEEEQFGGSTETSTPRPDYLVPDPQLDNDHLSLHIPATGPGSKVTVESSERPLDDAPNEKTTQTTQVTFIDEVKHEDTGEGADDARPSSLKSERYIDTIEEERSETESPTSSAVTTHRPVEYHSEDLHDGEVHIEVTSIPPGGRAPTPQSGREKSIQELSKSEEWSFCMDDSLSAGDLIESQRRKVRINSSCVKGDNWTKYITAVKPELYCFDCIPDTMSTKVGRTAGRMPARSQSASSQVLKMARKQSEFYKKNPPLRTPPSIPSTQHTQVFRESPRYGQTFNPELEAHARKIKSPRRYMEGVVDLRTDIRSAPAGQYNVIDPLSASLHVCRLDGPSRENTMPEMSSHTRGGKEPQSILRESTQYVDEYGFPRETTEEGLKRVGFQMQYEDLNPAEKHDLPAAYTASRGQSNVSLAHIGRPIAQYTHIGDPDEVEAAVVRQKEAKAAVDIQRIFRGYVARINYKKLLTEERERLEDERMAYNESQKKHKDHVNAKAEIYNRPAMSTETVEWSNKVKKVQGEKAEKRQKKMEELAGKNTKNYLQASSRLSTIGPHVNIYQIYHPKQTGPTKKELWYSATHIQKYIRGFLVRKRFEKLRRKAKLYGTTWKKLVRDYKGTLSRCQIRHGVNRPKTPFTIQDMNEYMDARRRYESVFEKKSFGGELEVSDFDTFFKECDLYPSRAEIEQGLDVILQGQTNKRRGVKKHEMLELVFYIYVPKCTKLPNTRQSTWMNPIIEGEEAKKLLGSEFVEPAPLEKCAKLVIDSKRERRIAAEKLKGEEDAQKTGKKVRIKAPGEGSDSDDST